MAEARTPIPALARSPAASFLTPFRNSRVESRPSRGSSSPRGEILLQLASVRGRAAEPGAAFFEIEVEVRPTVQEVRQGFRRSAHPELPDPLLHFGEHLAALPQGQLQLAAGDRRGPVPGPRHEPARYPQDSRLLAVARRGERVPPSSSPTNGTVFFQIMLLAPLGLRGSYPMCNPYLRRCRTDVSASLPLPTNPQRAPLSSAPPTAFVDPVGVNHSAPHALRRGKIRCAVENSVFYAAQPFFRLKIRCAG